MSRLLISLPSRRNSTLILRSPCSTTSLFFILINNQPLSLFINMKNKDVVLHGERKIRVEVRREGKEMFKHMADSVKRLMCGTGVS